MLEISHTTNERAWVAIRTAQDPRPFGEPEFSLTAEDDEKPGTFLPGRWVTNWVARNRRIEMETPRIGAGQDLPVVAGVNYWLWFRFSTDDELPVRPIGLIRSI